MFSFASEDELDSESKVVIGEFFLLVDLRSAVWGRLLSCLCFRVEGFGNFQIQQMHENY